MGRSVRRSSLTNQGEGGRGHHSRDEPVRYAVAERNECYGDERRDGIADVSPIDGCHLTYHQTADLEVSSALISSPSQVNSGRGELTKIRVQPVAQGGIEANIGERKIDNRKHSPVTIAVRPVLPPSAIPAPLSMKAVTGEHPNSEPTEMHAASMQYATVDRGKSPSLSRFFLSSRFLYCCTRPQNRAIE